MSDKSTEISGDNGRILSKEEAKEIVDRIAEAFFREAKTSLDGVHADYTWLILSRATNLVFSHTYRPALDFTDRDVRNAENNLNGKR